MQAITLVINFIREVFVKDDGVIRNSTYDEIKELGFSAFKKKHGI